MSQNIGTMIGILKKKMNLNEKKICDVEENNYKIVAENKSIQQLFKIHLVKTQNYRYTFV